MKNILLILSVMFISANIFGQSTELKDSLKTLKKNLSKYAILSSENSYSSYFKAKDFNSCEVSFSFKKYSSNASVTDLPVNGPSGSNATRSINSPEGNSQRRNQYEIIGGRRINSIGSGSQLIKLDLSKVAVDSISIKKEDKNIFSMGFDNKEIDTNEIITEFLFLRAKHIGKANEVMENFKKVVSLCQVK